MTRHQPSELVKSHVDQSMTADIPMPLQATMMSTTEAYICDSPLMQKDVHRVMMLISSEQEDSKMIDLETIPPFNATA